MIILNNGVADNQINMASTPILTVDNNTSTTPSSFSVSPNNDMPTLSVMPQEPLANTQPILTAVTGASTQPVLQQETPVLTSVQPESFLPTTEQVALQTMPQISTTQTGFPETTLTPITNLTTPVTTPIISDTTITDKVSGQKEKTNKKVPIIALLLIIIITLIAFLFYIYSSYKKNISELSYNCSPLKESKEGIELSLDSTLVKDLYSRVYTSVREDYAEPEFNDQMRLYLAYRQVTDFDMYESNCNMFDNFKMEPYKCNDSQGAKPKAISLDTMRLKWKTLYGEDTPMPLINIRLTNLCIGGYQYIPEREEFVEGYCNQSSAVAIRADKKLTSAISYNNKIVLTENVRYYAQENMTIPTYLKNGSYKYLFRLDMNYNYVLVSKTFEQKY